MGIGSIRQTRHAVALLSSLSQRLAPQPAQADVSSMKNCLDGFGVSL
jgi:hypothetical protein